MEVQRRAGIINLFPSVKLLKEYAQSGTFGDHGSAIPSNVDTFQHMPGIHQADLASRKLVQLDNTPQDVDDRPGIVQVGNETLELKDGLRVYSNEKGDETVFLTFSADAKSQRVGYGTMSNLEFGGPEPVLFGMTTDRASGNTTAEYGHF